MSAKVMRTPLWSFLGQVSLAFALAASPAAADELEELTAKATKGDAAAQFDLGQRYANGNGVAKDETAALGWYQKAAAQNHTKAEVQLGSFYAHGFAVKQDWAESIRWYRLAAAKGDTTAQHNLALDYRHGHGVEQDVAEAARWLRKAAVQGHARAQFNLGELYEAGQGVAQSDLEAYVLYTLAGAHENQEHIFGAAKAAEVIADRARVEAKLSDAQRAEGAKRVAAAQALALVSPRKFGAPGLIGKSRGWWVWKKWNPETWEAEVMPDPPGETIKVRVLPWATTYRYLAYGARFDELLPGEKINMFFDADENHRRGYVVHFQDEISQMKGHGHYWKVREVQADGKFTAQVFAGEQPLDERINVFEFDASCQRWRGGEAVKEFPLQAGDKAYLTWIWREDRRVVMLIADEASLETLKTREAKHIAAEIAQEGLAGQLDTVSGDKEFGDTVQFLVYSSYWAQSGQLQPGQSVRIVATGPGYRPAGELATGKVISQKNRGLYGSGVNDVMLRMDSPEAGKKLLESEGKVLRLIVQGGN